MTAPAFRVFPTAQALSRAAADLIAEELTRRVRTEESARFVVTGGRTPSILYALLAEMHREVPWERVHFYWSDERFVPHDHPDSNHLAVDNALLRTLIVDRERFVHPFDTAHDTLEDAAQANDQLMFLAPIGGGHDQRRDFDVVLLGLGEDGHVASLFPGFPQLEATGRVLPVHNAPKPPPDRLTLSFPVLNTGRLVLLLATGSAKADALRRLREGDPTLPAARLNPVHGRFLVFADREAWGPGPT